MKSNPLFFDSTKFKGDNVIVDIELSGVELRADENLLCHIIKHDGSESLIELKALGLRKWAGQARVEYQQRIKIEFIVKSGEITVEKSDLRVIVATYTLLQKWDRVLPAPIISAIEAAKRQLEVLEIPLETKSEVEAAIPPLNYNLPMIVEKKTTQT